MSRRARWIVLAVVLLALAGFAYWRLNQLALAAHAVDLPPSAEVIYEFGDRSRWSFTGHYSYYFRYVFAPGTPEKVCHDLEVSIGSDFRPFDTSISNPRPCEWQAERWGARVNVAVLEETELAPNNHPIKAPEGFSIINVSSD